jgi:hypothetical protein
MSGYEFCGDDCVKCEMDFFLLIEHLITDIQHLASEVVRLRHLLSWHLPKDLGETIRGESLSDLYGSYYDYDAYSDFVSKYCDGDDPMESKRFIEHMRKLSNGEESNEFRSLTF